MKLLLDTCTFLWLALDSDRLSENARREFRDPGNEVYLSSASMWEIVVKHGLGKLPLPESPDVFVRAVRKSLAVTALPLDEEATLHGCRLPDLHRDPFDRMLVCQAIVHGMVLATPDEAILQYPARTLW